MAFHFLLQILALSKKSCTLSVQLIKMLILFVDFYYGEMLPSDAFIRGRINKIQSVC